MRAITQESVLNALSAQPKSFNALLYEFILDQERQYVRLEKVLEKLIQQHKIEVIKEISPLSVFSPQEHQKHGSMLRYYRFKRVSQADAN